MRDYLRFFCVLAAVLCAGASRAASDADWSECKREDGDRAKIIAACARIAGDKHSPPRDRAIALNNRGNAYQTNKDFGRAIADPVALRGRGDIYVARGKRAEGDLDAAIADYTEAIRLDPRDSIAYRHRGLAYEAKGDGEHASADYNMVIQLRTK